MHLTVTLRSMRGGGGGKHIINMDKSHRILLATVFTTWLPLSTRPRGDCITLTLTAAGLSFINASLQWDDSLCSA